MIIRGIFTALRIALLVVLVAADAQPAQAGVTKKGDEDKLRIIGFLTSGFGWQHYSNDPVTEWGAAYPGVLGLVVPETCSPTR